jgi:protein CMS1
MSTSHVVNLTCIRMTCGVGTPQRIFDLLEDGMFWPPFSQSWTNTFQGALSANHVKRIVIDASHIDIKKRGILDMKDTQLPLVKLLNQSELRVRYGRKALQLIFY